MPAREWFHRWLKLHKKLNPHQQWTAYEGGPEEKNAVYASWPAHFDRKGIDHQTAIRASRRLQARPPGHPDKHLPAILEVAAAIRAEDLAHAERDSHQRARAQAAAEARETQRLEKLWRNASEKARRECAAAVEAEGNPLIRWGPFRHRLCLEELARRVRSNPPAETRTTAQAPA